MNGATRPKIFGTKCPTTIVLVHIIMPVIKSSGQTSYRCVLRPHNHTWSRHVHRYIKQGSQTAQQFFSGRSNNVMQHRIVLPAGAILYMSCVLVFSRGGLIALVQVESVTAMLRQWHGTNFETQVLPDLQSLQSCPSSKSQITNLEPSLRGTDTNFLG